MHLVKSLLLEEIDDMFSKGSKYLPKMTNAFSGQNAQQTLNRPQTEREKLYTIINSTTATNDEKMDAYLMLKELTFQRKKFDFDSNVKVNVNSIKDLNDNRPTTCPLLQVGIEKKPSDELNTCIHCGEPTGAGILQAFCPRCLAIHNMVGVRGFDDEEKIKSIKKRLSIKTEEVDL